MRQRYITRKKKNRRHYFSHLCDDYFFYKLALGIETDDITFTINALIFKFVFCFFLYFFLIDFIIFYEIFFCVFFVFSVIKIKKSRDIIIFH